MDENVNDKQQHMIFFMNVGKKKLNKKNKIEKFMLVYFEKIIT
jgi:hypothetical protein